jgi:hypothetical protein
LRPNIEYLNKLKQERGWSNTQLAIKIGISRMEVSRLLRGVRVGGKKTIGVVDSGDSLTQGCGFARKCTLWGVITIGKPITTPNARIPSVKLKSASGKLNSIICT